MLQREQVEQWDLNDPSTLRRLPSIAHQFRSEFLKVKANKARELDFRLELLRTNEEQRKGEVDGMDIELALRRLAKWCQGGENAVYNIASPVTHYFGREQRQFLLGLLLDIEESRRWNPRDHWHALHPEEVEEGQRRVRSKPSTLVSTCIEDSDVTLSGDVTSLKICPFWSPLLPATGLNSLAARSAVRLAVVSHR
jgi:hypothetical protein